MSESAAQMRELDEAEIEAVAGGLDVAGFVDGFSTTLGGGMMGYGATLAVGVGLGTVGAAALGVGAVGVAGYGIYKMVNSV